MRKNRFWSLSVPTVISPSRQMRRLAEKLVRDLYENGRLDVTAYEPADVDFLFEEDSEDFEEEDEDFDDEDMLNVYFADDDTDGIHIPRTIRFPKNRD